jgi:hypothetical protein
VSKVRYLLAAAGAVGIGSAVTVLVWALVCLLRPYTGLVRVVGPDVDEPNIVRSGEMLAYKVSYCVDDALPIPLEAHRELEFIADGTLSYIAPPIAYTIRQRCESRHILVGIPVFIPLGKYRLRTHTVLRVNFFRSVYQDWVSEPFEVVR